LAANKSFRLFGLAVIGFDCVVCIIMSSQEQKINNLLDRLRQESNPPRTSQMSGQQNIARNNGDVPQSRPSLQCKLFGRVLCKEIKLKRPVLCDQWT
jgi:hypothetical protein